METVSLVIKNADGITPDTSLEEMPIDNSTVGDVKTRLREIIGGGPEESRMKLVFSGRMLRDSEELADVLMMTDISQKVIFHLLLAPGPPTVAAKAQAPPPATAEAQNAAATVPSPVEAAAAAPSPVQPHTPTPSAVDPSEPPPPSPALAAAHAALLRAQRAQQQQQQDGCDDSTPSTPASPCPPPSSFCATTTAAATNLPQDAPAAAAGGWHVSPCPVPSATTGAAAAQQAQTAAPSSLGAAASLALPGGLSLPLDVGSVAAARVMDPAALQADVEKVYYDAYYKVYLEHYMSLMSGVTPESEEACEGDEGGGIRAGEWRDESDESISGFSAASDHSGDARAGTGLRNRRRGSVGGEGGQDPADDGVPLLPGARARRRFEEAEEQVHQRHEELAAAGGRTLQLALKLVFVVFLLGQDAPKERIYLLCALALCIFLHQTGLVRLFWFLNLGDNGGAGDEANNNNGGGENAGGNDDARQEGQRGDASGGESGDGGVGAGAGGGQGGGDGVVGLISDVTALILGFFTSLLPRTAGAMDRAQWN